MTSFLRRTTAPGQAKDHEKRVGILERKHAGGSNHHFAEHLDTSKLRTDAAGMWVPTFSPDTGWTLQEAGGGGGTNPVAMFENNGNQTGVLMLFTLTRTIGDTSWFSFPDGGNATRIRFTRPGVLIAILNIGTWTGGPHTFAINYGSSTLATGRAGTNPGVTDIAAGWDVIQSFVDANIQLSVNTGSSTAAMSGRLTLEWFEGG